MPYEERTIRLCLTGLQLASGSMLILPGGGGITTIYEGTGVPFFGVPFFQQKINFGVSFLVK